LKNFPGRRELDEQLAQPANGIRSGYWSTHTYTYTRTSSVNIITQIALAGVYIRAGSKNAFE